jgi:hypothetical protein
MAKIKAALMVVVWIGFTVASFIQMSAIYTFFSEYWGWWFIFAAPMSLIVGWMPLVGGIAGTIAAHQVWGWSLFNSILLFFWFLILYIPLVVAAGAFDFISKLSKVKMTLALVLIGSLIGVLVNFSKDTVKNSFAKYEAKTRDQLLEKKINKNLPFMINPSLQLTHISINGALATYEIKYTTLNASEFKSKNINLAEINQEIQKNYCKVDAMKFFRDNKINVQHRFLSNEGLFLYDSLAKIENCKN